MDFHTTDYFTPIVAPGLSNAHLFYVYFPEVGAHRSAAGLQAALPVMFSAYRANYPPGLVRCVKNVVGSITSSVGPKAVFLRTSLLSDAMTSFVKKKEVEIDERRVGGGVRFIAVKLEMIWILPNRSESKVGRDSAVFFHRRKLLPLLTRKCDRDDCD